MLARLDSVNLNFSELAEFKKQLNDDKNLKQYDADNENKLSNGIGVYESLKAKLDNLDLQTIKTNCSAGKYSPEQAALLSKFCDYHSGKTQSEIAASKGKMNGFPDIQRVIDKCKKKLAAPDTPRQDNRPKPASGKKRGNIPSGPADIGIKIE